MEYEYIGTYAVPECRKLLTELENFKIEFETRVNDSEIKTMDAITAGGDAVRCGLGENSNLRASKGHPHTKEVRSIPFGSTGVFYELCLKTELSALQEALGLPKKASRRAAK